MYKIRKIKFQNHPILKNLELDFCDINGNPVDTVIIAGENGTGKSTILDALYKIAMHSVNFECSMDLEYDGANINLIYYFNNSELGRGHLYLKDGQGFNGGIFWPDTKEKYKFSGLFSDVDINFKSENISNVTSLELDTSTGSKRSTQNLPKEIKQLLIDIQALDDADVSRICRDNRDKPMNALKINERMPRFTNAFNKMFSTLSYSRVENRHGHKEILFEKNGTPISIDQLSSGEKQIVYRGCFLLKDVNAMNGAFVFIDEPEISLHPNWQEKIMDYYKGIFTDTDGKQTSQIFAVTHSPFVIHNDSRRNDKVIILTRDANGDIVVKDKPDYYKCNSIEAVRDAFLIRDFSSEQATIYLEGQTDEKYFNKAVQVYNCNVPFRFKWVGYIDQNGQEANTGDKSVDKAFHFLVAQNSNEINVCLKDCDTNRQMKRIKNVIAMSIPRYENTKGMEKGIENALILDDIDLSPFYVNKEKIGSYGEKTQYQEFDKMACCDSICSMDNKILIKVFAHLKEMIDTLMSVYGGGEK